MVAFDAEPSRGDFFAGDIAERGLTGSHRFAVTVNRTRAAQAERRSRISSGHLQLFADGP